jgi:hypothetical protein
MTLKEKVLYCLEKEPRTRDSDTTLTNYLWLEFYRKFLFQNVDNSWCVKIIDLYQLPTQDDVKRWRAKIQNDKKNPMFLPTSLEVVKKRKINEELWRSQLGFNPELRTI